MSCSYNNVRGIKTNNSEQLFSLKRKLFYFIVIFFFVYFYDFFVLLFLIILSTFLHKVKLKLCPDRPKATATATKLLQSQAVAGVTFHSTRLGLAHFHSVPLSCVAMELLTFGARLICCYFI